MRIGPPAVPTGNPRRCSRCGVALWRRRGPRGKGEGEGRLLLLCRADWSWPPGARNGGRARTRHRSSRGAAPATALYTRWAQTELLPRCCLGGREQAVEARHERVALGLALALRNASAARREKERWREYSARNERAPGRIAAVTRCCSSLPAPFRARRENSGVTLRAKRAAPPTHIPPSLAETNINASHRCSQPRSRPAHHNTPARACRSSVRLGMMSEKAIFCAVSRRRADSTCE